MLLSLQFNLPKQHIDREIKPDLYVAMLQEYPKFKFQESKEKGVRNRS